MSDTPTPSASPDPATSAPTAPGNDGELVVGGTSSLHRNLVALIALLLGVFVIVVIINGAFRHWFALHTGIIHGGPDPYYNFWSGFGSDLGEATLISAVVVGVYTGVRKANCHVKGCWRIGHHTLDGTPYTLCKHHHPHVPSTGASHEHILGEYKKHLERLEHRERAEKR